MNVASNNVTGAVGCANAGPVLLDLDASDNGCASSWTTAVKGSNFHGLTLQNRKKSSYLHCSDSSSGMPGIVIWKELLRWSSQRLLRGLASRSQLFNYKADACRLSGPVPVCLVGAPALRSLALGGNALTGSLSALPAATGLRALNMSGNQLAGARLHVERPCCSRRQRLLSGCLD